MSRLVPGVLAAGAVAAVALLVDLVLTGSDRASPGPAVLALLVGVGAAAILPPAVALGPGLSWAAARLLQTGIVLLGLTVPVDAVLEVGPRALPVVVTVVVTAFATAAVVGRLLGVDPDLRTLVGAGTGICGASAVAATAGALRARPADVSYALSAVVLMNLVAVLVLPPAAMVLGLSDVAYGAWVGSAVNDTSAVVAVAGGAGTAALASAVVVKLTRVLALVPVTLAVAWRAGAGLDDRGRGRSGGPGRGGAARVPAFLPLFVLTVLVAAVVPLPAGAAAVVSVVVEVLLAWALAAVGLSTRLRDVARSGWEPVVLAAVVWTVVATVSLLLVHAVQLV